MRAVLLFSRLAAAALCLSSCSALALADDLVVGSKRFTESYGLGELTDFLARGKSTAAARPAAPAAPADWGSASSPGWR